VFGPLTRARCVRSVWSREPDRAGRAPRLPRGADGDASEPTRREIKTLNPVDKTGEARENGFRIAYPSLTRRVDVTQGHLVLTAFVA